MLSERPHITCLLATSDFSPTLAVSSLIARGTRVRKVMSVVGIRGFCSLVAGGCLTRVDVQIAACSRGAHDHIASRSVDMQPSYEVRPRYLNASTQAAPR
jgi:hypothetical protein